MIRALLKQFVHIWPWPLTLNEKYDRETRAVLKKVCRQDSVCIDIGCYKGEILKAMMHVAPKAKHFAFEPVPMQFNFLETHFGDKATIFPYALGNHSGTTTFHFVKSNPTYSGLQQRAYKGEEEIEQIEVQVRKLDDVISLHTPIHLIKIDVEGGELDVMKGGLNILTAWHPYLIFEHGIGGSDHYGTTPADVYDLLVNQVGYQVLLMEDFIKNPNANGLTKEAFEEQFSDQLNCYFLAVFK
jgi:FkbM family methyltransferase